MDNMNNIAKERAAIPDVKRKVYASNFKFLMHWTFHFEKAN